MLSVQAPQTRCRAAIARRDITPPVGIYHRMWGAAVHDRANGIHRPLWATLLWLEPETGNADEALLIVSLDHCVLDAPDVEQMQQTAARAAGVRPAQVLVTLTHTHAAGLMSRSRSPEPGGELIGPYLDEVTARIGQLAAEARQNRQPATIVYGHGRCNLAAHRDFFDADRGEYVCGFNPHGPADDTVLVAKIRAHDGNLLAAVVNYACHPTTLAWENTYISSDYVGALLATVSHRCRCPCIFLQGASADLGPRVGFVTDPSLADRNGRQLGYAALAALESLPPEGTRYVYAGSVLSGARLGVWKHEPLDAAALARQAAWKVNRWSVPLEYRPELPTVAKAGSDLAHWQAEESRAAAEGDHLKARECHARVEQAARKLWRINALPPDHFPLSVTLARLGDALWLFVAGEHYQSLQTLLRQQLPHLAVIVCTIANGWQPGYVPPAEIYGRGIYQEQIAVVAAGSAESVMESILQRINEMDGG
jgi:hypothetical protein